MKAFVLACLLAVVAANSNTNKNNDYDFELFDLLINKECLTKWWTNRQSPNYMQPIGQSLESFLAMVEKVEASNPDWDIYQISRVLLKRFAFEEMRFQDISGNRRPARSTEYSHRWAILSKLLPADTSDKVFKEDTLSDEEKCSMFFMMGHLVNNTFREGFDENNDIASDDFPATGPANRARRAKVPREQGVISVDGSATQAVAISKVLNAIVATQSDNEITAGEIIPDGGQRFPSEKRIKPVLGITLGDVLSLAAIHHKPGTHGSTFFGPGGTWNSTSCPTEFTLKENATGATNALLRGAVDGLLISKALKGWAGISGMKLSRVLRMYYSKKGLPLANGVNQEVSYCQRQVVVGEIGRTDIYESVLTFYYLHMYKEFTQVDSNSDQKVNEAIDHMQTALTALEDQTRTEECRVQSSQDVIPCETPSNVFFILDTSESRTDGMIEQGTVIGQVASRIDFGRGAGSLSIYLDKTNGQMLESISNNETNPTCAACKAAWLDRSRPISREKSELVILDALNKTLLQFERVTDTEPGVPSKVVVWFHYGPLEEKDKKKITKAANILKNGHRDTRLLVIGAGNEELSLLTQNHTNVFTDITNVNGLADAVEKRICKVPAVFQFNRCWDKKKTTRKEDQNIYTGYVTHNHVQFWAFHPEYYLKSFDIKVKFSVEHGDITVCERRGNENPGFTMDGAFQRENKNKFCKSTDNSNRQLVFKFSNPCHKYDVNNCPTINFAIIGEPKETQGLQPNTCNGDDDKCRRLDQVKFQVSHEGISCNGCGFLKLSPGVLLLIAFFYFFNH